MLNIGDLDPMLCVIEGILRPIIHTIKTPTKQCFFLGVVSLRPRFPLQRRSTIKTPSYGATTDTKDIPIKDDILPTPQEPLGTDTDAIAVERRPPILGQRVVLRLTLFRWIVCGDLLIAKGRMLELIVALHIESVPLPLIEVPAQLWSEREELGLISS